MPQDYTLSDAQKALQTDNKMLQKWIAEAVQAGEAMRPRVDAQNRRRKLLTRQQVERLAELHERTLPLEAEAPDRLATMERRLTRLEDALSATLERLTALEARPIQTAPVRTPEPRQTVHPPKRRAFTVDWRAKDWLAGHGVALRAMEGWHIPTDTHANILDYAKENGAALHQCSDEGCPCHDLID